MSAHSSDSPSEAEEHDRREREKGVGMPRLLALLVSERDSYLAAERFFKDETKPRGKRVGKRGRYAD